MTASAGPRKCGHCAKEVVNAKYKWCTRCRAVRRAWYRKQNPLNGSRQTYLHQRTRQYIEDQERIEQDDQP